MVIQMAQLAVFIYVSPQLRQDRRSLTPLRSHVYRQRKIFMEQNIDMAKYRKQSIVLGRYLIAHVRVGFEPPSLEWGDNKDPV